MAIAALATTLSIACKLTVISYLCITQAAYSLSGSLIFSYIGMVENYIIMYPFPANSREEIVLGGTLFLPYY